jgi:uncharacterized protein
MRRVFIALLAAALCCCGDKPSSIEDLNSVEVAFPNGTKILAEAARQQFELLRGLMYRDSLPANHGMMFFYPKDEKHVHYMYNAKIPVDIIWMDRDRHIVEMSPNTPPCPLKSARECPTYGGRQVSRYVLEVNAGVAAKNHIQVGDRLDF